MAYLPNRKIFFLLIFILLILAGWFFFYKRAGNNLQYIAKENSAGKNALEVQARETLSADSDNDGLQDWEETLWKTESKNSDTDNDGAPDGEEVNLNRNPLKPGPDDKISAVPVDNFTETVVAPRQNDSSLTDIYAKKFLTDYLTLKNQKGTLSDSDKDNLINFLASGIMMPAEIVDIYDISDIKISENNSKEAIGEYSKKVKKIIAEDNQIPEDTLDVFSRMLDKETDKKETNDEKETLTAISNTYKAVVSQLLSTSNIPDELKEQHVVLINGFNNLANHIKEMTGLSSDPIKAIIGINLYRQESGRIYSAIQDIQNVFDKYKVNISIL